MISRDTYLVQQGLYRGHLRMNQRQRHQCEGQSRFLWMGPVGRALCRLHGADASPGDIGQTKG